jgi:hypothetical protein
MSRAEYLFKSPRVPDAALETPLVRTGLLQKRSAGVYKRWQDRYFELRGGYLCYYRPEDSLKPNKTDLCLAAIDVTKMVSGASFDPANPRILVVKFRSGAAEDVINSLYLRTADESLTQEWCDTLNSLTHTARRGGVYGSALPPKPDATCSPLELFSGSDAAHNASANTKSPPTGQGSASRRKLKHKQSIKHLKQAFDLHKSMGKDVTNLPAGCNPMGHVSLHVCTAKRLTLDPASGVFVRSRVGECAVKTEVMYEAKMSALRSGVLSSDSYEAAHTEGTIHWHKNNLWVMELSDISCDLVLTVWTSEKHGADAVAGRVIIPLRTLYNALGVVRAAGEGSTQSGSSHPTHPGLHYSWHRISPIPPAEMRFAAGISATAGSGIDKTNLGFLRVGVKLDLKYHPLYCYLSAPKYHHPSLLRPRSFSLLELWLAFDRIGALLDTPAVYDDLEHPSHLLVVSYE